MSAQGQGGEPGAARLLALARRELLEVILPQLQGDARYRARLVANAMKIAGRELGGGEEAEAAAAAAEGLRHIAGTTAPTAARPGPATDAEVAAALCEAVREGKLDGHRTFYDLIVRVTESRRSRSA